MAHETAHAAVIDQQHRRIRASTHALARLQSEFAICCSLSNLNIQFFTQVFQGLLTAAQLTRQIGADIDFKLSNWLLVEHVVEGKDFMHCHDGHFKHRRQRFFLRRRDKAVFLLKNGETGNDRRLLLVVRVFVQLMLKTLLGFC